MNKSAELISRENKRILIVTDPEPRKIGLTNQMMDLLNGKGFYEVALDTDVIPEPPLVTEEKIVDFDLVR